MQEPKAVERILLPRQHFLEIEQQIRLQEHLRRYASIRRFLYGRVLDFACGCGYGTFLLSNNPEITEVIGVDRDEESIAWARRHYATDRCRFEQRDVLTLEGAFDVLVSLETIEHFAEDGLYHRACERYGFSQVILSYPSKKSTHFNPFHVRDLNRQTICSSFSNYVLYHRFSQGDVDFLLFLRKPAAMPSHIVENIVDLA
jgi:2-polyprenyl-3-methyl-5-hydroxy-6-metoxy-1,4-benzoquinol methylase